MVTLEDLVGIRERKRAISCLNAILRFRGEDGKLSPIITGYNGYVQIPNENGVITFSHIHQEENYKSAIIADLQKRGYSEKEIISNIRAKTGAFLLKKGFLIKDSHGMPYSESVIKYLDTDEVFDVAKYPHSTLEDSELEGKLYNQNSGWELNFPFRNQEELVKFVEIFIQKASKKNNSHWPGAYETPVLLLGERALEWQDRFPRFIPATKIGLIQGNNELSFIIHKNLSKLKTLHYYTELLYLGFKESFCLGNKEFIIKYIDELRKV